MKNIILPLTLGSTLLLTGCVTTTPAKTKVEAQEMATELAQNHDGLEALISSGIKINFRRFQYSPVVLYENVFGDFNVSKQGYKKGYGDLLNLDLGMLPNTTCGDANSSTIDHSTKCRITKTTYDHAVTFMGTKRAYDNSKDSLDKIYSELNKIDAFLKPMSVEERQYWGTAFVDEMKGRFTAEEFIAALKDYVVAYTDKLPEIKAQFEKQKVQRIHDEQKNKRLYEESKRRNEENARIARKQQLEKQQRIRRELAEERAKLDEYNSAGRMVWSLRFNAAYSPGDKVCSYDNKLGYIENVSENSQKVLWKGRVLNRSQGYFFGNRNQTTYKEDEFKYDKFDDTRWESKEKIGKCDFELL